VSGGGAEATEEKGGVGGLEVSEVERGEFDGEEGEGGAS